MEKKSISNKSTDLKFLLPHIQKGGDKNANNRPKLPYWSFSNVISDVILK